MLVNDFLDMFCGSQFKLKIFSISLLYFIFNGTVEESKLYGNKIILNDMEVIRCIVDVEMILVVK